MKKIILITASLIMSSFGHIYAEHHEETSKIACALIVEGDYKIKERLKEMGCKKGDPIMFYNHVGKAKWEIILPVRISALAACDFNKPISQIGAVGSSPYQSLLCTFNGEYREVQAEEKYLKGWNWGDF